MKKNRIAIKTVKNEWQNLTTELKSSTGAKNKKRKDNIKRKIFQIIELLQVEVTKLRECKEECKNYVKNFLDTEYPNMSLKGQLEKFKTYNFSQLALKENVHEDSTKLAKAVYFIIWHSDDGNEYGLPWLYNWQNMEEYYGGETINTFNSLFQENLEGARLYVPQDDCEFYKKVKDFQNLYLTIGNFMLLPIGKANDLTLNTKKGSYNFRYKDYCDLFLVDLLETSNLDDLKCVDEAYFNINEAYFKLLSKEEIFKKNILEDYCKNNKATIIFNHNYDNGKYYPMYWWKYRKNPKAHREEYRAFALDYIEKASNIINKRADKMMEILEQRLCDDYKNIETTIHLSGY